MIPITSTGTFSSGVALSVLAAAIASALGMRACTGEWREGRATAGSQGELRRLRCSRVSVRVVIGIASCQSQSQSHSQL